jgi:hypothetical protein
MPLRSTQLPRTAGWRGGRGAGRPAGLAGGDGQVAARGHDPGPARAGNPWAASSSPRAWLAHASSRARRQARRSSRAWRARRAGPWSIPPGGWCRLPHHRHPPSRRPRAQEGGGDTVQDEHRRPWPARARPGRPARAGGRAGREGDEVDRWRRRRGPARPCGGGSGSRR